MSTSTISTSTLPRQTATAREPLASAVVRKSHRLRKFARRIALNAIQGKPDTRVVFIMGAQRSGTRVPLVALESAPDILTYREGARPFFHNGRLADEETLDRLSAECAFPLLVLKPLCDSHRARQLLERFPGSRVLWIFRSYQDTVLSSSLKWQSGIEAVEQLVSDRLRPDDWRRGGLTAELLDTARRLYQPGLTLHHANAILWYLRSRLLLDQALFDSRESLVIKYEDLASAPAVHFPRVFAFIGQPLRPQYLTRIHANSVSRRAVLQIPAPVADACESLYRDIDRRYQQNLSGAG